MMPLRVLHVITGLEVGGAELVLLRLLSRRSLVDAEAEVVSLTTLGPVGERMRARGVRVDALGFRRGLPDPRQIVRLAALFRERRPQVIQSWMYHADLVAGIAARLLSRTPIAWGVRNGDLDPAQTSRLTRWTVRACAATSRFLPDRIVTCSQRARTIHEHLGYDASRFTVIPNGFDTSAFRPDPAASAEVRAELAIGQDELVIG